MRFPLPLAFGFLLLLSSGAAAQRFGAAEAAPTHEAAIVDAAAGVLDEIMAVPAKAIPQTLLADAQGLALVPSVVKGGFIVGVRHGRGVVVVRDETGAWGQPSFVTITGGSVGWQAGIQATDVILVFKTRKSIQGLMKGKFTLGADAAAAAGPLGREAAAATDARLRAEIYSYSRSRGLFAGVSLDGSAIQIDSRANTAYYGAAGPNLPGPARALPPSGQRLMETIAKYTDVPGSRPPSSGPPPAAAPNPTVQRQLAESARRLEPLLDESWKRYLALPTEVYTDDRAPTPEAVQASLARFNAVVENPQYQALARRPEFQEAHGLLRRYAALRAR
jgi:lipid-binding SYLF domain-containing protein